MALNDCPKVKKKANYINYFHTIIYMKLTKLHLFLIVLSVLVASTLGFSIKEYFDAKVPTNKVDSNGNRVNKAMEKGDRYNPFETNDDSILDVLSKKEKKKQRRKRRKRKGGYDCLIAELEDNINPHRRERRKKYDEEFDDDRWMLKSSVVPPVCPKCPDSRTCPRQKPCPPCKPCGRCPEPSFTCKKVPNYNAVNASSLGGAAGGGKGQSQGDGSYDSNGNMNDGSKSSSLPMARLNSFARFN